MSKNEKCTNKTICISCKRAEKAHDHFTRDKDCPEYKKQKEIQTIKTLEKVDIKTAIATYNQRHNNNQQTYASIIKNVEPRAIVPYEEVDAETSTSKGISLNQNLTNNTIIQNKINQNNKATNNTEKQIETIAATMIQGVPKSTQSLKSNFKPQRKASNKNKNKRPRTTSNKNQKQEDESDMDFDQISDDLF